jgi:alpha-galactosidase
VGAVPSGLRPPLWWGLERDFSGEMEELTSRKPSGLVQTSPEQGVVLPGSVLINSGVADAPVNPDHALIYTVDAVD